jgi:hypothetical protein
MINCFPKPFFRGYRQVKNREESYSDLLALSHRPTPFSERNHPEISIMFSANQVSTQIEKIVDGGINTQKP